MAPSVFQIPMLTLSAILSLPSRLSIFQHSLLRSCVHSHWVHQHMWRETMKRKRSHYLGGFDTHRHHFISISVFRNLLRQNFVYFAFSVVLLHFFVVIFHTRSLLTRSGSSARLCFLRCFFVFSVHLHAIGHYDLLKTVSFCAESAWLHKITIKANARWRWWCRKNNIILQRIRTKWVEPAHENTSYGVH